MTKKSLLLFILLSLTFSSLSEAIVWENSYEKGMKEAAQTGKAVFVDFYTDWCGWCKKLDSEVYTDSRVQELAKQMICIKVDCDRDKSTPGKYGVEGFPTLLLLTSGGEVIEKHVGFADKEALASLMKNAIGKAGPPKSSSGPALPLAPASESQVIKAEQFYKLGVRMEQLGRKPQAVNFYSKAAELAPNSLIGRKAQARAQALKQVSQS